MRFLSHVVIKQKLHSIRTTIFLLSSIMFGLVRTNVNSRASGCCYTLQHQQNTFPLAELWIIMIIFSCCFYGSLCLCNFPIGNFTPFALHCTHPHSFCGRFAVTMCCSGPFVNEKWIGESFSFFFFLVAPILFGSFILSHYSMENKWMVEIVEHAVMVTM